MCGCKCNFSLVALYFGMSTVLLHQCSSFLNISREFTRSFLTNPARRPTDRKTDGQIERASAGHHRRTPVKVDIRPAGLGWAQRWSNAAAPAGGQAGRQAGVLVSIQSTRATAINCTDVRRGRRWKSMRRPALYVRPQRRHARPHVGMSSAREGASPVRAAVDHTGGRLPGSRFTSADDVTGGMVRRACKWRPQHGGRGFSSWVRWDGWGWRSNATTLRYARVAPLSAEQPNSTSRHPITALQRRDQKFISMGHVFCRPSVRSLSFLSFSTFFPPSSGLWNPAEAFGERC